MVVAHSPRANPGPRNFGFERLGPGCLSPCGCGIFFKWASASMGLVLVLVTHRILIRNLLSRTCVMRSQIASVIAILYVYIRLNFNLVNVLVTLVTWSDMCKTKHMCMWMCVWSTGTTWEQPGNNRGTTGEQREEMGNNGGKLGNNGGIMACDTRGKKMQNTAVTAESLAH